MRAHPLTENHGLVVRLFEKFGQHRHEFIDFAAIVGLMIEQRPRPRSSPPAGN